MIAPRIESSTTAVKPVHHFDRVRWREASLPYSLCLGPLRFILGD